MASRILLFALSTPRTAQGYVSQSDESPVLTRQILPVVMAALLVGLSYYVGTRIGFAWTPAGRPNSTFWPPNAVLLAALMLTRRKEWWTLLVAVLAAHMIAQLQTGVPVWTAAGWFVTNSSEALIGAYCITRFSDRTRRLDGVRGVLIFVAFGVLFAPFATSFLDAFAVVVTRWGKHYWPLSLERFWTNALAELTIVPLIVLCCRSNPISWLRRAGGARVGEAALLAIGTVLVAVVVFGLKSVSPATTPALLYVPLPFLLWAASRFGLGGLSASLLSVALISTWYTMHGREAFPNASMSQNILSLQILFCIVAVPLMFLSAVMAEARRSQDLLRGTSARLIEAQEQERARIGRELHDDVNQRLAMLAVELERLQDNPSEVRSGLQELRKQTTELSHDVQALSHDLHSSKVEYLGAVGGMKSWCKEFGERQRIQIEFKSPDTKISLPREVGLSLFRVLQEALHNAVKHSGVRRIEVQLREDSGEIHLVVSDLGRGFDWETAMQGRGLGLTSMQERVLLVNGTIEIQSKPSGGTTVHVRVPFGSEKFSEPGRWLAS